MEVTREHGNGGIAEGENPSKEEDELKSTRAEISEVKQENERLKTALAEMIKDYHSLQSQFSGKDNKESKKQRNTTAAAADLNFQEEGEGEGKGEEPELKMCLSLGASGSYHTRRKEEDDEKLDEGGLDLDLRCGRGEKKGLNLMEKDSSIEESREEEGDEEDEVEERKEGWVSRKILKTRSGKVEEDDLIYNHAKKARVSIRARCDGIMMNDGCQWRKYGQKIAKANPCPRAYYRCTAAQGCPVRKQVQRCVDDMSILTTTYEGKHNHPLPPAATAIATTTSAAVDMLLSGSSNSKLGSTSMAPMTMDCSGINGMNFNVGGTNSRFNRPVFLSISQSHPTVTLDLTSPESSKNTQLGRFSTNHKSPGPRYQLPLQADLRYHPTTTTFNYPSQDSTISGYSNHSYNGRTVDHHHNQQHFYGNNKNPFLNINFGGQQKLEENCLIQSSLQKITSRTSSLTDTITEATKAVTSDPGFQSALAATVATVLGGNGRRSIQEGRGGGGGGGGDMLSLGLKREEEEQQQQHLSSVLPQYSSSSTWMGRFMGHRDANWK